MQKTDTIQDKEYWEQYYSERKEPFDPSLFAQHVAEKYLKEGDSLIELGCGNGRDAVFLAARGIRVTAVDQCENEIGFLSRTHGHDGLSFISGDFTALDPSMRSTHVYSRFTMHSISVAGQASVVDWVGKVLDVGGCFLLEFRGKLNELYEQGDTVPGDPDAFIHDGHYRRFLDMAEFCQEFEQAGFEILESVEDKGFSPFAGDDETFARVIARKAK